MADIGAIGEIINSAETTLEVGSDNYIALKIHQMHIGRIEIRDPRTDGTASYSSGPGDNYFTGTLYATTPELSSLNTLTQLDSAGDYTSTTWKIVYKDIAGTTRTFTAPGNLVWIDIKKSEEPDVEVEIDFFVRITGNTVADA